MKKLTNEQRLWLETNYCNYYNKDLAIMLGVSLATIKYHASLCNFSNKKENLMDDAHKRGAQKTNKLRWKV